jgi:hypothetical protein
LCNTKRQITVSRDNSFRTCSWKLVERQISRLSRLSRICGFKLSYYYRYTANQLPLLTAILSPQPRNMRWAHRSLLELMGHQLGSARGATADLELARANSTRLHLALPQALPTSGFRDPLSIGAGLRSAHIEDLGFSHALLY